MADKFLASKTAPTAGNAASKSLVAASAGNSIFLWKVVIQTTTATTDNVIFQDGSGGTTLLNVQLPVNTTLVLPFDEIPLAATTVGNGLFFQTASTTIVTAYYTTCP